MDDSKSDTGSQELNTYAKQDNCASRAPEVILKHMRAISSYNKPCKHFFFFFFAVAVVFLNRYTFVWSFLTAIWLYHG